MTKLITKIAIILLPILVVTTALEVVARKIPSSYGTKLDLFNAKKDQLEVLVLGTSHSNHGIDPQFFGREGFNFANVGQSLYQDYGLLDKYLPECKNLKLVILPISYFSLQYDMAYGLEPWRSAFYRFYLGINGDRSSSAFDIRKFSALALWGGPLEVVRNSRTLNKLPINKFGYQPQISAGTKAIITDATGKERVILHRKIMHSRLLQDNIAILDQIANELSSKRIKVVFITTPVHKSYFTNLDPDTYNTMINSVLNVSTKYSATYINYSNDVRFQISDFYDNDHLNQAGAKKFSLILKNEVIDKYLTNYK